MHDIFFSQIPQKVIVRSLKNKNHRKFCKRNFSPSERVQHNCLPKRPKYVCVASLQGIFKVILFFSCLSNTLDLCLLCLQVISTSLTRCKLFKFFDMPANFGSKNIKIVSFKSISSISCFRASARWRCGTQL